MNLDFNLDTIEEAKAAPAGKYSLVIVNAVQQESGPNSKHPGSPIIRVTLAFEDLSFNAPSISHYISLPFGEDDENTDFKLLMLKRFLVLFNLQITQGQDLDALLVQMPGQSASAQVSLITDEATGSTYNRLVLPRLQSSAAGRGTPPRR